MKTRTLFAALALGLLASCAQMTPLEAIQNTNVRKAVQNARTRSDHDALTKYFEGAAKEMQTKAEEQRRLLEHYEEKSYLHGRQAEDRKSQAWALARKYEETAKANIKEAAAHRQMALEAERRSYVAQDNQ
jgi:Skp family chaperone for outer membrane proteins